MKQTLHLMTTYRTVCQRLYVLACTLFCLAAIGGGQTFAAELRILSYNIHHGRGLDGEVDLERIAKVIKSAQPDLVALNEVDKGVNRSGKLDEPAELARLTGMHHAFEKNIEYDGGEYGNAILSRWPIEKTENVPLPSHYEGEQRGMLMVKVASDEGQSLWFAATHLDYRPNDAERVASTEAIEKLIASRFAGQHFVLAGDFNALPKSRVIEQLARTWMIAETGYTFPADEPVRRIDYVMARPVAAWRVRSAKVLKAPLESDHRPVLVVLEMDD